jgi:nicotinamide-nucleotide amidase
MLPQETLDLAERALAACRARGLKIATAESCTGGLIAAAFTHIAGSSDVFERGFVTYSNEAKSACLGVPPDLIATHGAVSEPVARAMAWGVLNVSPADLAISVTGIAGPGGGSVEKPVGLVWFGYARRGRECRTASHIFAGDRSLIRAQAVRFALDFLEKLDN